MNFVKKLSNILDTIVSTISGVIMSVLTVITLSGVVFRYVFGNPLAWVYEFTIVSFVWMIFLGTAMAFKENEHISLDFVVSNLPPKVQYYWREGIYVICIIFLLFASFNGFKVTMSTWGQSFNTIPVRKGVFYLSFSLAAIPAIVHIFVHMMELKIGDKVGHDPRVTIEDNQEGGVL